MKAGFGLVSLLIVVGLIVYMQATTAKSVNDRSKDARKDAAQFAGQDTDGVKAKDSITLEAIVAPNGKLRAMKVATLMPAGPMEKYFGLKVDDQIIQANQLDLRDLDAELAPAMVLESYSRKTPIIIMRGDAKLTLPQENAPGVVTPPPAQPAAADPRPVEPAADPSRSTIQGQLDKIPGIKR